MKLIINISLFLFFIINCSDTASYSHQRLHSNTEFKGLNLVAPAYPFPSDPMPAIKATGANWVAAIPYAYTIPGEASVHYDDTKGKWWGETMKGCKETVRLAQQAGLNVLLKPQVYVPGSWTGDLDYATTSEWEKWERDYEAYILPMADLAAEKEIPMLCIATEIKIGAVKREAFWRALIQKIRERYTGKLSYAANWDNYEQIPFWDALDYVGINAYFPLVEADTPTVKDLKNSWQPIVKQIARFQKRVNRPILFTEFGYLAVDRCAYNTWELEAKMHKMPLNEEAQANALNALFEVFWKQDWWHGGFVWKWYPNLSGTTARKNMDYTPQGKAGEIVVRQWYKEKNK